VETISPAIRFRFEEFASRLCDEGKVEAVERPYKIREWTGRLERLFRERIADGMTTDEVGAVFAIETFGPAESIIKMLRGGLRGLWHRLVYHQSYSVHRLVAPVVFILLHCWLRTSDSLKVRVTTGEISYVWFGWNYYIGVMTLVTIVITRAATRILRIPKLIGQVAAFGFTVWLFYVVAGEWLFSIKEHFRIWAISPGLEPEIPVWAEHAFGGFLLALFIIEALAFFFVLALTIAEIFDFPMRRRMRMRDKTAGVRSAR
jgi:hypothetical protein